MESYNFKAEQADYTRIVRENEGKEVVVVRGSGLVGNVLLSPDFIKNCLGRQLLGYSINQDWGTPYSDGWRGKSFPLKKHHNVVERVKEIRATQCTVHTVSGSFPSSDNLFEIIEKYGQDGIIFLTKPSEPRYTTVLVSPKFIKKFKGRELLGFTLNLNWAYPILWKAKMNRVYSGCYYDSVRKSVYLPKGWQGMATFSKSIKPTLEIVNTWKNEPTPKKWNVDVFGPKLRDSYFFIGTPDFNRVILENPKAEAIFLIGEGDNTGVQLLSPAYIKKQGYKWGWPGLHQDTDLLYYGCHCDNILPNGWLASSCPPNTGETFKKVIRHKMCTVTTPAGVFHERLNLVEITKKYGDLLFVTRGNYDTLMIISRKLARINSWIGFPCASLKGFYGTQYQGKGVVCLPKDFICVAVPSKEIQYIIEEIKLPASQFTVQVF